MIHKLFKWANDERAADLSAKLDELKRKFLDLQSQLDAKDRIIAVRDAEIDELAAVVARNHTRVTAETADWARHKAEAELNERRHTS